MNKISDYALRITHLALVCVGMMLGTGCADMLEQDDDLTMTPSENTLSTPNDTVYSVTGTVTLMQKVMDRLNLLGEVRGDLVRCTPAASTDLQNLAAFNLDSVGKYNTVADYYAIINNCNYFINTVDTAYSKRGQSIFKKEYAVMKTYRAWTYLQLALNYGSVPFYTHFLASAADGQAVLAGEKRDLNYICNYFIDDLAPYVETLFPQYGSIGGFDSQKFYIPVRLMLGELCLYAGRYMEAAQYYHDYITHRDNPQPLLEGMVKWRSNGSHVGDLSGYSSSHTSLCSPSYSECLAFIPFEETELDGTVSYLDDIYNSTVDNYYYYQLTCSEALYNLSSQQNYCLVYQDETNVAKRDTLIVHTGDTTFADRTMYGDLRLASVLSQRISQQASTSQYNKERQTISSKIYTNGRCLYRLTQVYLHYAEALNRAGFPSAAMMILKYGVCPEHVEMYVSEWERDRAGSLLTFSSTYFPRINSMGRIIAYSVHGRGCGDADADTTYVLPLPEYPLASMQDTIEYQIPIVEDMIVDEAALECCFEGTRFNDLVRIALRRGDEAYLADRVARRDGETDGALRARLMNKSNWYLPLP